MEEATAATSTYANVQEDEADEVLAMAEPEMEVDMADMDDEAEPDEEQQEDYYDHEDPEEIAERRPVILQENQHITDPARALARISTQVPYHPNAPSAYCIEAKFASFAYMA